ncbi:MAG: glutathione S-transferase family protein [Polyangiaceae bacterium]
MITLYAFGPAFGLPDSSPFVTKVAVLLQLARLPYEAVADTSVRGLRRAPKGKLPYIVDSGTVVPDSTFIRFYLEARYGIDFDCGLAPADRAVAWAFEKMCEDHLYWAIVHARWMVRDNFDRGPRHFFDHIPAPIRPLVMPVIRRRFRNMLHGHGMGRHTKGEVEALAARTLGSISAFLADKPFFMGDAPCGADATIFAFVAGSLCAHFVTPMRSAAEAHANLVAYRDRGMSRWFPECTSSAAPRLAPAPA